MRLYPGELMAKPSGKPRPHRGKNKGGRPTHKEQQDRLWQQIQTLRQLLHRRRHNDATWQLIKQILDTHAELEDLATPLRSRTVDSAGHPAETLVLPGVTMTDIEGSRELQHAGSYAQDLLSWYDRMLHWTVDTTQKKLRREQERPRPTPPKRVTNLPNLSSTSIPEQTQGKAGNW